MSGLLPALVLACRSAAPPVEPYGNGLFVTTGVEYVHAELIARRFCKERGQPGMRPVDKVEQTVHVTGSPRIGEVKLIFCCEPAEAVNER